MAKETKKQIALFGGSFDPPHLAHLQVIHYLQQQKRFDEIWVMPARQHPFKKSSAGFEDRLAMCRLVFDDETNVAVHEEDRDSSGYTVDLIELLQNKYPDAAFSFVGGSDLEKEIARWKDPDALQGRIEFLFLPRPPDPASPFLPFSSTEIREHVKNRLPISRFVPKAVEDYIATHPLYRE